MPQTVTPKAADKVILDQSMSVQEALGLVASGKVPMEAYLEWDAERVKLLQRKSQANQQIRFKVSEKGAVSVYGLSAKWPVTLYASQWARLLGVREQLEAFIAEHKSELSFKAQS